MLSIRFWGVRGSIASAGSHTAQVGGNTSCVEVRCGDRLFILDAGTGLRALGAELAQGGRPVSAHLLLSHFHWDHIQGFPFFAPGFSPATQLAIYGPAGGGDLRALLAAQMRAPHFPVGLEAVRARLAFHPLAAGADLLVGDVRLRAASAHHPNGCLAYRLDYRGRAVVYATDTEHRDGALDEDLLALARGADVLVYDAQYTEAEYAPRKGWGHSTAAEGARLARAAAVSQLVLFHHDPGHDDWEIARIEAQTRALFPSTTAAREGLRIGLPPVAASAGGDVETAA